MEKPGHVLGAVSYGRWFLCGGKGGMGRGTDISAGSSVRETALHPGGIRVLPPIAAQRGVNQGQLHLPATPPFCRDQEGTEPGLSSGHVLGPGWATMLCLLKGSRCCAVSWDEHNPALAKAFSPEHCCGAASAGKAVVPPPPTAARNWELLHWLCPSLPQRLLVIGLVGHCPFPTTCCSCPCS